MAERRPEEADEIYEEVAKDIHESKIKEKGWAAKLDPQIRIGIIVGVGAGMWYIIDKKIAFKDYWMWVLFAAFVIYMLTQVDPNPKKLTEAQTAACLYRHLTDMQRIKFGGKARLGPGRIIVTPEGKELWLRGKPWKREHSFKIIDSDNIPRLFSADVNIWDGDLIAVKKRMSGYTGHESKDVEILPGKDLEMERRRDKFLNPGKKGM